MLISKALDVQSHLSLRWSHDTIGYKVPLSNVLARIIGMWSNNRVCQGPRCPVTSLQCLGLHRNNISKYATNMAGMQYSQVSESQVACIHLMQDLKQ